MKERILQPENCFDCLFFYLSKMGRAGVPNCNLYKGRAGFTFSINKYKRTKPEGCRSESIIIKESE